MSSALALGTLLLLMLSVLGCVANARPVTVEPTDVGVVPTDFPQPEVWARVDEVDTNGSTVVARLTPLKGSDVGPGDLVIVMAYSRQWTQEHVGREYTVGEDGSVLVEYDLEHTEAGWYVLQLRENNTGRPQYIWVSLPTGEWQD